MTILRICSLIACCAFAGVLVAIWYDIPISTTTQAVMAGLLAIRALMDAVA